MFKQKSIAPRAGIAVAIAIALASQLFASSPLSAIVSWQITDDSVSLGLTGVSPYVERAGSVDRLWRSGGLNGSEATDCTDAGSCTAIALSGRFGSDFSALKLADGTRRGYFDDMLQGTSNKQVFSAPCATSECFGLGTKIATSSELVGNGAWGVPDPVLLPDGRVRIYVVESPVAGSCSEKIASYIADASGVTFTKEAGWRLEGGYVDTEVLRAKAGDWLMITSNGPGCGQQQKLFITVSIDGLMWSTPTALTGSDKSRLDPTGYEVSTDVFRIYYATSATTLCGGDCVYTLARATLKIAPSAAQIYITGGATTTIATSGVKAGNSCTKVGAKAISGKTKLTCKNVGGKLVWSK